MHAADATLVAQLSQDLARRIEDQGLRPGTRLPSIRQMAEQASVSRFTVVEAYERLVAQGLVQSRRGAGFFVQARRAPLVDQNAKVTKPNAPAQLDTRWMLRSLFGSNPIDGAMPASAGCLPPDWLDADLVAGALRSVGRTAQARLLGYGHPQGYAPLRQQLAALLQTQNVPAHPDLHLLTTSGVTHGLDLVARLLVQPGDTVLVEDPAWYVIFGRLAAFGARVIGVPRGPNGPDMAWLEQAAAQHKPKLFITNSTVHNPTGYGLSAGSAYDMLRVAEKHDFMIVEDLTYAEFHPNSGSSLTRLAELDRLNRVILAGGFAKTLAASLRVGWLAAKEDLVQRLSDIKMLGGLTSSELSERVVHRVLADGAYRRHVERVRLRVDEARTRCLKRLLKLGYTVPYEPQAGIFIWTDCGRDSEQLAREAAERGLLIPPGSLFSPTQAPSRMARISVAIVDEEAVWKELAALK
ncbi:aminotransferase-like domain-containing protein [Hylemonella gracilis]|uniref:GntR family transcriptional regulator n=1 Tax=Hylemonella gracilis ATCC 19624 TaxID=887062 RepID=F3KSR5_9BURK|nr:PLP-dependent aminotransferase family protein [Hylemonella gracilis]EGI77134.1 GntR family transcriptional regulator [Hylemonella gracilis ATCC 19624]